MKLDNPVLSPQFINGVKEAYVPRLNEHLLSMYFPHNIYAEGLVKWDVTEKITLTSKSWFRDKLYSFKHIFVNYTYAPKPWPFRLKAFFKWFFKRSVIHGGQSKQFEVAPPSFRERTIFDVPSVEPADLNTSMEKVADTVTDLRIKVANRMEYLASRVLDGRILIHAEGIDCEYDYPLRKQLDKSYIGSSAWTESETAVPIEGIKFCGKQLGIPFDIVMNSNTAAIMLKTDEVRKAFHKAFHKASNLDRFVSPVMQLANIVKFNTDKKQTLPEIIIYNDGYFTETLIVRDIKKGDTTIFVENPTYFNVGDTLEIQTASRNSTMHGLEVDTVFDEGACITFKQPIGRDMKMPRIVRKFHYYIPDGIVYLLPKTKEIGNTMLLKPGIEAFVSAIDDVPGKAKMEMGFKGTVVPTRNNWSRLKVY